MNTYRIYEEFRSSLGEPAAKSLAQTLGTMFEELRDTVTKEDFRSLRTSLDGDIARLDKALCNLAEAQARTEGKVSELAVGQQQLAEAQARTEGKVSELAVGQQQLAEAQARTEARVSELAEAQARTEGKVSELAQAQANMTLALQRLTIRTDTVVGRTFELQFRDRLTAYLGRFLRRGKLLSNDQLLEAIEPHVTEQEMEDFLRADAVASGFVDGRPTHVVVEVSSTGDVEDIVRAERRAATLRKAGLEAIALVACDAISPESMAIARMSNVRVWCNGCLVESAA
jgi:multidrug efflux pump subunit AcrA (membrane-fusion protein)